MFRPILKILPHLLQDFKLCLTILERYALKGLRQELVFPLKGKNVSWKMGT